jgi:hypothetical protein
MWDVIPCKNVSIGDRTGWVHVGASWLTCRQFLLQWVFTVAKRLPLFFPCDRCLIRTLLSCAISNVRELYGSGREDGHPVPGILKDVMCRTGGRHLGGGLGWTQEPPDEERAGGQEV